MQIPTVTTPVDPLQPAKDLPVFALFGAACGILVLTRFLLCLVPSVLSQDFHCLIDEGLLLFVTHCRTVCSANFHVCNIEKHFMLHVLFVLLSGCTERKQLSQTSLLCPTKYYT
jgi:hypothetical protein